MKKWQGFLAIILTVTMMFSVGVMASQPAGDAAAGEAIFGVDITVLPRNETFYLGGWQWNAPISGNPFAPVTNMLYVDQAVQSARIMTFETLYMYNIIDGQLYPLLAYGQPEWNEDATVLTVRMNLDAKWSDGTRVTARDMETTFNTHVKVGSAMGAQYGATIAAVKAVCECTLEIHTNPDNYNPFRVLDFLPRVYVLPGAYIESKWDEYGEDNIQGFRSDTWFDAPFSGPYGPAFISPQKVVLERNEDYWGQAKSMWGKLPVPRYVVHNIYASNDSTRAAFSAGEIDLNQQFIANVWTMWERDGLPISTYLDAAPYYIPQQMPTIWFNTTKPGLDQLAVRQAIAYAIDYEQIALSAMSGYSPTFDVAPRSIAAPVEAETRQIDFSQLEDLQWIGPDIERANAVLDAAGIVDTTGNGIRDWQGEDLVFTLQCPSGWSDWEASLEIVAAAGAAIGINLVTNFVDQPVWTDNQQTGNFDIIMINAPASNIAAPWTRAQFMLQVSDPDAERFFSAWHRLYDPEINALIDKAAAEQCPDMRMEYYTQLSIFLLEQKPLVYLMYRPSFFQTYNESVWTGFPEEGDEAGIPPMILSGHGIGLLYNIRLR